ncbi:hypothetical protein [Desulfofalx alkaliphila]|uniref:hypothetical protein n=1 Tax=Desulfofalx alkaliphila TaxID=105483 RepID=UPI0004E2063D|nr:hypothetical protein [Desulfofalx alkaliphila]
MKRIIAIVGIAVLLAAIYTGFGWANSGSPGSSSDPLVTRSFVERYVSDRLAGLGGGQAAAGGWEIEEIKAGGIFEGAAGTEVVLRSGRATCIDPSKSGILNMTKGDNVHNGQKIPSNNMLIIPRDDGRGIKAETEIIIMYKGAGTISY